MGVLQSESMNKTRVLLNCVTSSSEWKLIFDSIHDYAFNTNEKVHHFNN
jgi:hypothetical protein